MQLHRHDNITTYWTLDDFFELDAIEPTDLSGLKVMRRRNDMERYSICSNIPPVNQKIHRVFNLLRSNMFTGFLEKYLDMPKLMADDSLYEAGLKIVEPGGHQHTHLGHDLHRDIRFGKKLEVAIYLPVCGKFTGGEIYFSDATDTYKEIVENVPNRLVLFRNNCYHGITKVNSEYSPALLFSVSYLTLADDTYTRRLPLYIPRRKHADRKYTLSQAPCGCDQQIAGKYVDTQS